MGGYRYRVLASHGSSGARWLRRVLSLALEGVDADTWGALHQVFARELVLAMEEEFRDFMGRSQKDFR